MKKENYEQEQTKIIWKNIKDIKIKKNLLYNYVEDINECIENEIIIQKNKLLSKSLCYNLKYIDENNIIMDFYEYKIINIIGIYINKDGLLCISSNLYKNKKIPR
jgi:hypothetical protein